MIQFFLKGVSRYSWYSLSHEKYAVVMYLSVFEYI